LIKKEI